MLTFRRTISLPARALVDDAKGALSQTMPSLFPARRPAVDYGLQYPEMLAEHPK